MRPSMSPLTVINEATPLGRKASSSMVTSPIFIGLCSASASTASAALMKGWISSILIGSAPVRGGRCRNSVVAHHVFDHLVQDFRLHRLLDKMARAFLQRGHDVFLIADGRHHN